MKIAYLIQAHRNPELTKRLVDRLSCDDSAFFIHIDRKSDITPFSRIGGKNIFFEEGRIEVYWSEYSMVEATLKLMRRALSARGRFDYCILLSGSDYPLRSKEYIHAYFEKHRGMECISMVGVPSVEAGIPLFRIDTIRFPSTDPIRRFIFRLLGKVGLAQRDHRKELRVADAYGGSTWWALSAEACQYIIDVAERDQRLCKYFARTFVPDEMFFHTILGNSRFKPQIRRNVLYDDWKSMGPHSPHPASLCDAHVDLFESSDIVECDDAFGPGEMLFARKFSDESLRLLDRVDQMIARKERGRIRS